MIVEKEKEVTKEFIWLNNDFVFKHVLSDEVICRDFLNSFLEYVDLEFKIASLDINAQKFVQNENLESKDYYLDILIVLSGNRFVNLEMYNSFGPIEIKKSLAYAAMLYTFPLRKGDTLSKAKKVISLNIIKGGWKDDDSKPLLKYELINSETGTKLTEEGIEMYLAPLDNLKNIEYSKDEPRCIKWLRFIDCNNKDEVLKLAEGDEIFMSAKEMVRNFVSDPEVIRLFHNDNWKEESAELRGIELGREQGREQGIELGREQGVELGRERGIEEEKLKTAKEMLKNNCDIKLISKITKLPVSKIKTLM